MNLAYVYEILPTQTQEELIHKTFGCSRLVYNQLLSSRKEIYEKYKEDKEALKAQKKRTPASLKGDFPFLREVDSLALSNAQLNLEKAYQNFFRDKKVGFPKFKSKHRDRKSYTTNNQKGSIRLLDSSHIQIPKLGKVKIRLHREIPENSLIKSATLSMNARGRYKISLLLEIYEEPKEFELKENLKVLGLDYSSSSFYIDSEGREGEYPKFYRKSQKRLAREQRKLSKQKKGSQNREKQKRIVAHIHEKVANQRKDFLHKRSREIANLYDVVVVEDLNLRGLAGALHLGKATMDNGFGMFRVFLKYKLEREGKKLLSVDKFFPSSKRCSGCGHKKESLLLSERVYFCEECHLEIDRDLNASLNLKEEGIRLLSFG